MASQADPTGPDTSLSPRPITVLSARPARVPSPAQPPRGDGHHQHGTGHCSPADHRRGRHSPGQPRRPRRRHAPPPPPYPQRPPHAPRRSGPARLGPRARPAHRLGVEGTGSYGAALARFLAANGQVVVEVNPPDRQARRRRGKSDPLDAEAAARAVQAGQATVAPKAGTGQVEMIRSLRVARATAIRARTQAINALKALLVTAPAELREQLRELPTATLGAAAAALVPGPITSPLAAALLALGTLARRHQALNLEIKALTAELDRLTATPAPKLGDRKSTRPHSS